MREVLPARCFGTRGPGSGPRTAARAARRSPGNMQVRARLAQPFQSTSSGPVHRGPMRSCQARSAACLRSWSRPVMSIARPRRWYDVGDPPTCLFRRGDLRAELTRSSGYSCINCNACARAWGSSVLSSRSCLPEIPDMGVAFRQSLARWVGQTLRPYPVQARPPPGGGCRLP
jgi:hypothetical protein